MELEIINSEELICQEEMRCDASEMLFDLIKEKGVKAAFVNPLSFPNKNPKPIRYGSLEYKSFLNDLSKINIELNLFYTVINISKEEMRLIKKGQKYIHYEFINKENEVFFLNCRKQVDVFMHIKKLYPKTIFN